MPVFDTPEPISVTVELGVGNIRIVASDRTDTIVEMRPSNEAKKSDVAAAEQTRVEYADGRLLIKGPKNWRQFSLRGGRESIDVQIDLPAGSHVRGSSGVAGFHSTGRLGEVHVATGMGDIHVDQGGDPVELKTGYGDITVGTVGGHASAKTGSGAVRMSSIHGTAAVKNANGDTWIGEVTAELSVRGANGKIVVDKAHSTVGAKTANGDVRLGEVAHGAVRAETAFGKVDVGISEGVTAWLDLNTRFGRVQNELDATERPDAGKDTVEVRAHSSFGDITIRRAPSMQAAR